MARFKVDENLPSAAAVLLREAGHDAVTILDQRLGGQDDAAIHRVCRAEGRAIVTLDRGFGDPRRHPTAGGPGVIVLRPGSQDREVALALVRMMLIRLEQQTLAGSLWIVEPHRIRIRQG